MSQSDRHPGVLTAIGVAVVGYVVFALPQPQDLILGEHVAHQLIHLDILPVVDDIVGEVAERADLYRAGLAIHWELSQVHVAAGADCQSEWMKRAKRIVLTSGLQ